eukprot:GFYU01000944.1.p1 GENE.GFYU01000944.1~~GFYU01000944.1.p1  ORF type:complete len:342 (-),score=132.12 GFYU01000944.1:61-1086(-)
MVAIEVPKDLDVRRKAQIAYGKPTDHCNDALLAPITGFDLDKTIFTSLEGYLVREVVRSRFDVAPFWSDKTVMQVGDAYSKVPRLPAPEQPLLDFMSNDCNFAMEHADGSFMDHLLFCAEYSFVHYKQHSPKVLFLHSIMGVGTNYFPMEVDKLPKLKTLLSDFEYEHIEAFPTILRLINHRRLVPELAENLDRLKDLESITCHRVIDNEKFTMSAEQLWVQLNFQLIHLLDFLPCSNWASNMDDNFLCNFVDLHNFLTNAAQLQTKVDLDLTEAKSGNDGAPLSVGKFIRSIMPSSVAKSMAVSQIERFSGAIGHSLDYTLTWKGDAKPEAAAAPAAAAE